MSKPTLESRRVEAFENVAKALLDLAASAHRIANPPMLMKDDPSRKMRADMFAAGGIIGAGEYDDAANRARARRNQHANKPEAVKIPIRSSVTGEEWNERHVMRLDTPKWLEEALARGKQAIEDAAPDLGPHGDQIIYGGSGSPGAKVRPWPEGDSAIDPGMMEGKLWEANFNSRSRVPYQPFGLQVFKQDHVVAWKGDINDGNPPIKTDAMAPMVLTFRGNAALTAALDWLRAK